MEDAQTAELKWLAVMVSGRANVRWTIKSLG